MRVSASCPPSTNVQPAVDSTSTTVIEQLSRRRITSRSSPTHAPMTALMATKCENATVSRSTRPDAGDDSVAKRGVRLAELGPGSERRGPQPGDPLGHRDARRRRDLRDRVVDVGIDRPPFAQRRRRSPAPPQRAGDHGERLGRGEHLAAGRRPAAPERARARRGRDPDRGPNRPRPGRGEPGTPGARQASVPSKSQRRLGTQPGLATPRSMNHSRAEPGGEHLLGHRRGRSRCR